VPEISTVGLTEQEVKDKGIAYECGIARFRETSRGHIMGLDQGMMKMIFSLKTRRLLGVHIVGEGATELIHIGQAVLNLKGTVDYFVENTFNYPTLAEAYKIAALDAWNRMPRDQPYYVVPADELAEEAYVVLREALRQSRKVGLGQLAIRGQEFLVSLKPCGRGLILETLRYADEVNKAANYFRDIGDARPDADLLELATTLIDKKSGQFDAGEYHNRYIDALHRLIEKKAKAKGKRVLEDVEEPGPAPGKSNVIDLMAALKASVEGRKSAPEPAKKPAANATPRSRQPAATKRKRA
jgi:hypothetical protein